MGNSKRADDKRYFNSFKSLDLQSYLSVIGPNKVNNILPFLNEFNVDIVKNDISSVEGEDKKSLFDVDTMSKYSFLELSNMDYITQRELGFSSLIREFVNKSFFYLRDNVNQTPLIPLYTKGGKAFVYAFHWKSLWIEDHYVHTIEFKKIEISKITKTYMDALGYADSTYKRPIVTYETPTKLDRRTGRLKNNYWNSHVLHFHDRSEFVYAFLQLSKFLCCNNIYIIDNGYKIQL